MLTRRDFARLAATGAAASLAARAGAQAASQGNVAFHPLTSRHVPGELGIAVYRPPGYDRERAETYPLLLFLHGGNGSERDLLFFKAVFDAEIGSGRLPPMVIAMPSGRRSLYMDYKDGSERWESFILSDVIPLLRRSEHIAQDRARTCIGGVSMGGLGALRIAFKHPQLFAAVAALEPAIEATLTWRGVGPETRFWRPETALHPMFGEPIDAAYWEASNPATIASRDPARLSDLRVYLEVGDQDMLFLYEGAEFLHRVLFDARLAHEFRLVHGADHVGPSLLPRMADALGFIGRQLSPPAWTDQRVLMLRNVMERNRQASGFEVEAVDPRRLRGGRASGQVRCTQ